MTQTQKILSITTLVRRATFILALLFMHFPVIHCNQWNQWEDGFRLSPRASQNSDPMKTPESFHELVKPPPLSTTTTNVGDDNLSTGRNYKIKTSKRSLVATNSTIPIEPNRNKPNEAESPHPQPEVLKMEEGIKNETVKFELDEIGQTTTSNYESGSVQKETQLFHSNNTSTSQSNQIFWKRVKPSMAERRVEKGRITCDLGSGISFQKEKRPKRWVSRKGIEKMVKGKDPITNLQKHQNRRNAKIRLTADSAALNRLVPLVIFAVNTCLGAFLGTMKLVAPL